MAKFNHYQDFIKYLTKKGFKEIGAGCMATAYGKTSSPYIIKIFLSDQCYVHFLHIIANNKELKAFPKILSYGNFKTATDIWHIVKIEKLIPITTIEYYKNGLTYIKDAIMFNTNNHNPDNEEIESFADVIRKEYPELYKVCTILGKQYPGRYCSLDIRSDNIMKRANGDYVIIDPFA